MAQAYWKTIDEVPTGTSDQLYFQKGTYHFFNKSRNPEPGFRFIWRVHGKLQARPARIDSIQAVESLLKMARDKKWDVLN